MTVSAERLIRFRFARVRLVEQGRTDSFATARPARADATDRKSPANRQPDGIRGTWRRVAFRPNGRADRFTLNRFNYTLPRKAGTLINHADVEPEAHTYVYVTVTDPMGGTHGPLFLGSLPTWAAADGKAFAPWKRARRAMVLDEIGMSDRVGFRFRYAMQDSLA